MFGVLYLRNVLKFIIHGFYNSSFWRNGHLVG